MEQSLVEMGNRLRQERERLGLTQREMAAAGGQAVNSQSLYERGERAPGATYLAGIAESGADVLYIVTGRRSLSPEQAEARLATIDAAFKRAMPTANTPERTELEAIALDPALPDRTRAAADTILYVTFGDEHAAARRSEREKRQSAFGRRARLAISEAAGRAGWAELPPRMAAGLERVMTLDQDTSDEIVSWVLEDLLSAIREGYLSKPTDD